MTFDEAEVELQRIDSELNEHYRGKKAEIVSAYNGQPHGSSRKPLTGQRVTIECVMLDSVGVSIFVKGQNLGLRPYELRILDEGGTP